MKHKIPGIVLGIIGLAGISTAMYIQVRIDEGKAIIGEAQGKIEEGNPFLSFMPAGKIIGDQLTKPAKKQIAIGTQKIKKYERVAFWVMIGGVALGVAGFCFVILHKKHPPLP